MMAMVVVVTSGCAWTTSSFHEIPAQATPCGQYQSMSVQVEFIYEPVWLLLHAAANHFELG
jgi:hypothetical protein